MGCDNRSDNGHNNRPHKGEIGQTQEVSAHSCYTVYDSLYNALVLLRHIGRREHHKDNALVHCGGSALQHRFYHSQRAAHLDVAEHCAAVFSANSVFVYRIYDELCRSGFIIYPHGAHTQRVRYYDCPQRTAESLACRYEQVYGNRYNPSLFLRVAARVLLFPHIRAVLEGYAENADKPRLHIQPV